MRLLFLIIITAIGIFATFKDAFNGLLLYAFYTFFHPLELVEWTSFSQYKPSFLVGLITILTAIAQRKKIIINHKLTYIMIIFIFYCYLTLCVRGEAISSETQEQLWLFCRLLIFTFITSGLISNLEYLIKYMKAIALFLGPISAYYGFLGLITGASNLFGNMPADNNLYAAWLNMQLPIVYYVGNTFRRRYLRNIFKVVFIGNILAIIITFSRGGFLTLCFTLFLIITYKMKKILFFVLFLIAGFLIVFLLSNDKIDNEEHVENRLAVAEYQSIDKNTSAAERTLADYRKRIDTLKEHQSDKSIASRRYFWQMAIRMANDNPLFGIGFNRFREEYDNYDQTGGFYGSARAIHNTVLEVLSETGYPGFVLFISLLSFYFISLLNSKERMRKCLKEEKDFPTYVDALVISMLSNLMGTFFVNGLFYEFFWAEIGIAIAMSNIAKNYSQQNSLALQKYT